MSKYIAILADLDWSKVFVAGLLLGVFYWYAVYDDGQSIVDQIKVKRAALTEANRTLAQTKKAMEDANRFEREVQETTKQFEHIVEFMPAGLGGADLTSIVNQRAGLAGVRVSKIEPKSPDTRAGFYEATRAQFSIEGNFAQILTFLSMMSQVPKLLTYDQVELSQAKANEGGPLTLQALLVGYRYLKDAPYVEPVPAAPGSVTPPNAGVKQ